MVVHAAFLLLVCCSCLQQTGAVKISYEPSGGEGGEYQLRGVLLGDLTEKHNGRHKRTPTGSKNKRPREPTSGNTELELSQPSLPQPLPPQPGCELEWGGNKLPLILRESDHAIISPITSGGEKIIRINADESVIISCGREHFKEVGTLGRPPQYRGIAAVRAYCNSNNGKLIIDEKRNDYLSVFKYPPQPRSNMIAETNDIEFIRCQGDFQATAIAITELSNTRAKTFRKKKCNKGEGYEYHIVTFDTTSLRFFTQIKVCFDQSKETTFWTQHTLPAGNSQVTGSQGTWKEDYGLFPSNMGDLFTEINEPVSRTNKASDKLTTLLGRKVVPPPTGIGRNPQTKIAKGHLSPNADFATQAERMATFHYINALPQWQADNNGNWAHIVEVSVKELAKKEQTELTIITGGYGVLHLIDSTGNDQPIYLKSPELVPVPKFMWKVVHKPNTDQGVAFVIYNNPFIGTTFSPSGPEVLCKEDVCDKLDASWFDRGFDRTDTTAKSARINPAKGYTYCCRVDELKKHISSIPDEYKDIHNLLGERADSGK